MSYAGVKRARENATILFQDEAVRVTNRTVVVKNITFSIGDIRSASRISVKPRRTGPVLLVVVSLLLLIRLDNSSNMRALIQALASIFLAVSGALWWKMRKTLYVMRLAMRSGVSSPLQSNSKDRIDRTVEVLNQVLASRENMNTLSEGI
jgi:hypothetical protein